MIIVPVRVVSKSDAGLMCRLGSEPSAEAAVEFMPKDCMVRISESEGTDLAVVVIDPDRAPSWLKSSLGLG